jgi:acetate kinase
MGFTPVEGLLMGTRVGDLDIGVVTYLMEKEKIGTESASTLFNKHSGLLGITGISSDFRDIQNKADEGNERALLAMDMYNYRIKKYVGAYTAAMDGCDILVFTGGIGENSSITRAGVCNHLSWLGFELDQSKNDNLGKGDYIISKDGSRVKIMVIPTDEEWMIALDTKQIIEKDN